MAKRRGKGEGAIYERKDGRWAASVEAGYKTIVGKDGKPAVVRVRQVIYGRTRDEVRDQLITALKQKQQGLPINQGRQTVGQFLERWLDTSARDRLRPTTLHSYEEIVKLHIVPEIGRTTLTKLSPQDVQNLLAKKLKEARHGSNAKGKRPKTPLSPRRVQFIRAVLRAALNQALRWGLVARNVATLVDGPRVPRHDIRPLAPEEVPALLDAIRGDKLEGLYILALATGMRQGELLGLRWQDVDLERGNLRVVVTLQRIGGVLQLVEPKTDRSRRVLELPRFAVAALRAHRARQLEDRLLAGSRWQETGLVFTSGIGTPLPAPKVTVAFQALLKRADLPRQRFHDLRHACASLLFAQGVDPKMVMDTLGHSQISTTLDIYTHILPAMRKDVAERMNAVLGG